MNNENNFKNKELYNPFQDKDIKKYQIEAKKRWGNTSAYKQSINRVKKMTKEEMQKIKNNAKIFTQKISDNMDKGSDHKIIQKLISQHFQSIQFFYDCSIEMYRNLGNMYVEDSRFAAYYDKFKPNLSKFMQETINIFCDRYK